MCVGGGEFFELKTPPLIKKWVWLVKVGVFQGKMMKKDFLVRVLDLSL